MNLEKNMRNIFGHAFFAAAVINVDINAFFTMILKFAVVLYRFLFTLQSVNNRRF